MMQVQECKAEINHSPYVVDKSVLKMYLHDLRVDLAAAHKDLEALG